ncbi:hypothetical protein WOLCODRAFT_116479 [Wolfiporia cocos MD-104 SS10]|uniref:Xylanolytic transcriptional activator regulatory domain-containing protein n=1 Tax=Wolfiporia cocos (strain MD-104) TaxID=742152 RepID=A0A2H3JCS9_WOLCO|nr:hypothetical protein WOLCODRAFT_116479 [Wolfiporia cocos MD-104 SS10]
MQDQIHELAKTLPPPRKQNTACDACRQVADLISMSPVYNGRVVTRARKVKCNVLPGQDKVCRHCLSKNLACTHFVQQATTEKRRNAAANRTRPRTLSTSAPNAVAGSSRPANHASPGPSPTYPAAASFGRLPGYYGTGNPISMDTPTKEVLAYLFSPPPPRLVHGGGIQAGQGAPYGYNAALSPNTSSPYADWGKLASRLGDEAYRIELALDLVEVFFQIVHTRLPLLHPAQFRDRLHFGLHLSSQSRSHSPHTPPSASSNTTFGSRASQAPSDTLKPLHPALVATVIAWGAKFSAHPLFDADREHNNQQSLLAKTLINRARDIAEDLKVHRVPSADHVVIALLIEPMQNQSFDLQDGFHGFWLGSAIRLLLDLQINHKSVMSNIKDRETRGTMIFAWWMACLADAYRSVYYRRKPMLDDDDYDIDFYTVGPVPPEHLESQGTQPSPREQLEFLVSAPSFGSGALHRAEPAAQGYYRAAHALARIARQMSRQLWRPATESDGIPFETLESFMNMLSEWREEHLSHVGVPRDFDPAWDFVSAVTACASDATYHIMWIILFNALDDFGIREVNDLLRTGSPANLLQNAHQIEAAKERVMETALSAATRIAGLAGILTMNDYLKLDSAVMHVSIIQAGTMLARLGRPEVQNCINGLQQYSYAYEECAEQAAEIRRIYHAAVNGEMDLNHMLSVAPRAGLNTPGDAMHVDPPMFGGGYRG